MFEINNWYVAIIVIFLAMFIINYACGKLEEQLDILGKKLKIPTSVRGATFDAISSSLPEFLTAMMGLIILKEKGLEVGIGTISGSAIFNILIIPFCSLLVFQGRNIKVFKGGVKRDVIFYLISISVLLIGLFTGKLLIMGISLISVYVVYLMYLYRTQKHYSVSEYVKAKYEHVSYFTIFYALVLTFIGVEGAIYAAQFVGDYLGISTMIISLVLLAGITSIPDTFLSMKSAKRGDIDASLSNAVGSNIFDICIGLGVPITIGIWIMGLNPTVDFFSNLPIFIFLIISVFVYLLVLLSKKITKKSGYYLLFLYIVFIFILFNLI